MSGFPDDRLPEPGRPLDPRTAYEARSAVAAPATLLMVTGVLTAVFAAFFMAGIPNLPQALDQTVEKIQNDPKRTDEEKDKAKEMAADMKRTFEGPVPWVAGALSVVFGGLMVLGGAKLLKLSGPTLPAVGSVLAMVPCTSGLCCVLGLPAGIWALVVMNRPAVRAAMAANRSAPPPNPDDQYMR